jgi:hypothetical protein
MTKNSTILGLSPEGEESLKKFLLAGGLLGTSVGTATALVNWLKTLHTDAKERSSKDDDTIIVTIPRMEKQALSPWDLGVGMTGSILAFGGANLLVRNIAQAIRRKQIQKRVDEAQKIFIKNTLLEKNLAESKEAFYEKRGIAEETGKPLGALDILAGGGVTIPLLILLASGVLSYKALDKYFPPPRSSKAKNIGPKKVVLRYADKPEEEFNPTKKKEFPYKEILSEVEQKEPPEEINVSAAEQKAASAFLARVVLEIAPNSDPANIVKAAASGRLKEMEALLLNGFYDAVSFAAKTAGTVSEKQQSLGLAAIAESDILRPVVEDLSALEFLNKGARVIAPAALSLANEKFAAHTVFTKMAALLETVCRRDSFPEFSEILEKSASEIKELPAVTQEDLERILKELSESSKEEKSQPFPVEGDGY